MIRMTVIIPKIDWNLKAPIKKSLWQSAQLVRNTAVDLVRYRTWALRRSITERATDNSIEVWSDLIYAWIQERWWTITPKNWPYLIFKVWWKRVKTKRVTIKWKPYMKPALERNTDKIVNIFNTNIMKAI